MRWFSPPLLYTEGAIPIGEVIAGHGVKLLDARGMEIAVENAGWRASIGSPENKESPNGHPANLNGQGRPIRHQRHHRSSTKQERVKYEMDKDRGRFLSIASCSLHVHPATMALCPIR